jgi:hypothetical protein
MFVAAVIAHLFSKQATADTDLDLCCWGCHELILHRLRHFLRRMLVL